MIENLLVTISHKWEMLYNTPVVWRVSKNDSKK